MAVCVSCGCLVQELQLVRAGFAVLWEVLHEPVGPERGIPSEKCCGRVEEIGCGPVLGLRSELRWVCGVSDG